MGACRFRPARRRGDKGDIVACAGRLTRLLDAPLIDKGVAHEAIERRLGESVLSFKDPDGMRLALVAVPAIENEAAWRGNDVPGEHAIRGFHSVSLLLREVAPTKAILIDVLGFSEFGSEDSTVRFKAGETEIGGIVDIRVAGDFLHGRQGAGSVHHIAFRAADDEAEFAMLKKLEENHGIRTTDQKDLPLFPLALLPRAGWGVVRDRNRRPRFHSRRASRLARPISEVAAALRNAAKRY